jgi:hypothetical protein
MTQTYLLEELPEDWHRFFAVFLLHDVLEIFNCHLFPAAPNLRAMNCTFPGQVGQEGCWVPVYDFGHRVGADTLILADESTHGQQGFIKMLEKENDPEFWK